MDRNIRRQRNRVTEKEKHKVGFRDNVINNGTRKLT